MKLEWYSCKIRMLFFVKELNINDLWDSLYLIKANNFEEAFEKTLEIGQELEESYLNSDNQMVNVLFKEVLTLDHIGNIEDGTEVLCDKTEVKNTYKGTKFNPQNSKPQQTV